MKRFLAMLLCAAMLLSMLPLAYAAEEPGTEPAEEPFEEPIPAPTEEPIEAPTEEPIEEPTEEPIEEPPEEPIEEPPEEPIEEPTPEPTEAPTPEPTEEPIPEPTEEPIEEPTVMAESINISAEDEMRLVLCGETLQLTATVLPETATDKTVTWSSSDNAVATVDENGLVTGLSFGEVIITALANDGSGAKGEYTLVVDAPMTLASATLSPYQVTTALDNLKSTYYEGYKSGIECYTFARELANKVFGSSPANPCYIGEGYDGNGWLMIKNPSVGSIDLEPGDIIDARYIYNAEGGTTGHTAIVWKVENGQVYVAESWGSQNGAIHWGFMECRNDATTVDGIINVYGGLYGAENLYIFKRPNATTGLKPTAPATPQLNNLQTTYPVGNDGKAHISFDWNRVPNADSYCMHFATMNSYGDYIYDETPLMYTGFIAQNCSFVPGWYKIDFTAINDAGSSPVKTYYFSVGNVAPELSNAVPVVTKEYNNHLYERYDYHMGWSEAKAYCEALGGHLVTIENEQENNAVASMFTGRRNGAYYIGCTDVSGSWSWITGEAFSYQAWSPGEPSGGEGYGHIYANSEIDKIVGSWNDTGDKEPSAFYHGYGNTGFICEYDSISSTSGTCGENLTWTLDEAGTLTISGTGTMEDYASITDAPWGSYAGKLNSLIIADGVTSIGDYAFYGCNTLKTVSIPSSISSVGRSAFKDCVGLMGVYITDLASWCEISFVDGFSNPLWFEHNLYLNNALVRNLEIPEGVSSIGKYAFSGCNSLTIVSIPESVTNIGVDAFQSCSNLTSINIADSVIQIGSSAFNNCSSLTSINIPHQLTKINNFTFCGCSSLTKVVIPEGVVSVSAYAFFDCNSLKSITIPNSIKSIGTQAFYNCTALSDVYYGGTEAQWAAITVEDYNELLTSANIHYTEAPATSGTCGESLTWVLDETGTLTIRGTGAMWSYSSESPAPWERVKGSIRVLVMEPGVTSIGNYVFSGCSSLTSITISEGVTSIGHSAFSDCNSLTSVNIPDGVTNLGINTFAGCSSLTSIDIPNSVTNIDKGAFYGCSNLTYVNIPNSVTIIDWYAFYKCSNLTSITIPDGVTSIGTKSFTGCTSLTSVSLPDSLVSVSSAAFDGCTALSDVYYGGTEAQWAAITVEDYNEPLTSANIHYTKAPAISGTCGENLTWTLDSAGTLTISGTGEMKNYKSGAAPWYSVKDSIYALVIEPGITSIGGNAFCDCGGIISVNIPDGVLSIEDSAFKKHNSLLQSAGSHPTDASMSVMIGSLLASFPHFSIPSSPVSFIIQKSAALEKFFDKLAQSPARPRRGLCMI